MPFTKRDIITWAKLLELVAQMALAAVAALNDDDPVDFDAVKITTTPEEALRRLSRAESREARGSSPAESRGEPSPASGER